jgi:hypothetical protein
LSKTSCRNCAFATYSGKTQDGCKLGRIDRLREIDPTLICEAYNTENEIEKEFFVVQRLCNGFRQGEKYSGDYGLELVRRENTLIADILVYIEDTNLDNLILTIKSVNEQKLMPRDFIIIVNSHLHQSKVINSINEYGKNIPQWHVSKIQETKADRWRCLDIVLNTEKTQYYIALDSGTLLNNNFISCLNHSLNESLDRFVMLTPDDDLPILVVQTKLHKFVGGSKLEESIYPVVDKINMIVKEQKQEYLVKKVSDICT